MVDRIMVSRAGTYVAAKALYVSRAGAWVQVPLGGGSIQWKEHPFTIAPPAVTTYSTSGAAAAPQVASDVATTAAVVPHGFALRMKGTNGTKHSYGGACHAALSGVPAIQKDARMAKVGLTISASKLSISTTDKMSLVVTMHSSGGSLSLFSSTLTSGTHPVESSARDATFISNLLTGTGLEIKVEIWNAVLLQPVTFDIDVSVTNLRLIEQEVA